MVMKVYWQSARGVVRLDYQCGSCAHATEALVFASGSSTTVGSPFGQSAAESQRLAWQASQDIPAAARRMLNLVRCPRCGGQTRESLARKVVSVAFSFVPVVFLPLMLLVFALGNPKFAQLASRPSALPVAMALGAVMGLAIGAGEWRRWSRVRQAVIFREDPAWSRFVP
jgi:hypothetical protein